MCSIFTLKNNFKKVPVIAKKKTVKKIKTPDEL